MGDCCDMMDLEWINDTDMIFCKDCKAINKEETQEENSRRVIEENSHIYLDKLSYSKITYQGYKVIHHVSEV